MAPKSQQGKKISPILSFSSGVVSDLLRPATVNLEVEVHACFHREHKLRARIVESLEWMVNKEEDNWGGYSPKLQVAIDLLKELRGPTIENGTEQI